ncbi:MAG: hypothetical protein WBO32_18210, partial [Cyclobacteriaceae bacterium]
MRSVFFKILVFCFATIQLVNAQTRSISLSKIDSAYSVFRSGADERVEKFLKSTNTGRVTSFNDGSRIFLVDVSE